MMKDDGKPGVMLISVGGSPAPILYSLNTQQPEYVIFFTSKGSRSEVRERIEPGLTYKPKDHEIIVTPDEQDLNRCVSTIMGRLPDLLALWDLDFTRLSGDYTGGTKSMAAAVVLALLEKGCRYSYVGGTSRDKDGKGQVVSGSEQILYRDNPWDELAVNVLQDLTRLFNRCRFQAAAELAAATTTKLDEKRPFFDALKTVLEGYAHWDSFSYAKGLIHLRRGEAQFRALAVGASATIRDFQSALAAQIQILDGICREHDHLVGGNGRKVATEEPAAGDGGLIIRDILANAVRRMELEHKYDDAAARIYSAIEKMAKLRLKGVFGLDNSDLDLSLVADVALRDRLARECSGEAGGKVQLPLHKSYQLLEALGDPLGAAYRENEEQLRKILATRNMSLLAHGFAPVGKESCERLLRIALEFICLSPEDLPSFVEMNWGDRLFAK